MKALINRYSLWVLVLIIAMLIGCRLQTNEHLAIRTISNPINLNYRFCLDDVSRRDAANPCIVLFDDDYYLFMSGSGGYYHSSDLMDWHLVDATNLPAEGITPTVVEMDGALYYASSDTTLTIYKTNNPKSGTWEVVTCNFPPDMLEPMLFYDEGRLYLYAGSSNSVPLTGVEIDPHTFQLLGKPSTLIESNWHANGWETPGDYHDWADATPWLEGMWMNKRGGKYYLQYASPGIQLKTSNTGVYVSDTPLGPFTLSAHNPLVYRPDGFTTGAGNGSIFQDKHGNYWYVGTVAVTTRHFFERRLSLYPVFFDADSVMYACTELGDYPMIVPDHKVTSPEELFPGWMLLSHNKSVRSSSELRNYPACCAVDETIRTWWSAATADKGEYLSVDLGEMCEIHAVQINFADHDSRLFGRNDSIFYQYYLEESSDGRQWNILIDKSANTTDAPHDYIQLDTPVKTRYVRLTNLYCPSGKFSVSGLRVFGLADKPAPVQTAFHRIRRNKDDRRSVLLKWKAAAGATGYGIRFGTHPEKLYSSYMVYNDTEIELKCLQVGQTYYFAVDSFNEGGITRGDAMKEDE
ncbi:family 43 glycosylhydrolase [Bacteroides sp. UBA939]|uniref:family 43 glycosylhydrolase n=1 Tax=Bacteroides sp. UBA939 TaxID=1946092 RepID=UPI0025C5E0A8|nr:family 43 glycosylhydrolase [Bacteroides sp. UBA939]